MDINHVEKVLRDVPDDDLAWSVSRAEALAANHVEFIVALAKNEIHLDSDEYDDFARTFADEKLHAAGFYRQA
jgi:hypothetical protein